MKIVVDQRSDDWHFLRAGLLTLSELAAAIGVNPYCSRAKLFRQKSGLEPKQPYNEAMQWGNDMEPVALAKYETKHGKTEPGNFWISDDLPWLGGSPDFINGEFYGEIKCPFSKRQYGDVPAHYMTQVQGGMYITGLKQAHFVVYTPQIGEAPEELSVTLIERNDAYIDWMLKLAKEFYLLYTRELVPPRLSAVPYFQGNLVTCPL